MTLLVEDKGLRRMQAVLAELKLLKVKIGYQAPEGGKRYESGIKVARLAAVHEFGIPNRSFMRSAIKEGAAAIAAFELQMIQLALAGSITAIEAMSRIGSFVLQLVRRKLQSAPAWAVPLDEETIDRKGSATPLSDTRRLVNSLSWRVTKRKAGTVARGTT